jgi:hypothetical protein
MFEIGNSGADELALDARSCCARGRSRLLVHVPCGAATREPFPEDLPYTLGLPDDWLYVTGDATAWAAYLDDRKKTDPDDAARLTSAASRLSTPFHAVEIGSGDSSGCGTRDTGGRSASEVLRSDEEQNIQEVASASNITKAPVAHSLTLPVGETVRMRWAWTTPEGHELAASMYAFAAADNTIVACLFQGEPVTADAHQPEWESILRTSRLKGTPPDGASPATT